MMVMMFNRKFSKISKGVGDVEIKNWEKLVRKRRVRIRVR